jgi:hypothetical protein
MDIDIGRDRGKVRGRDRGKDIEMLLFNRF